MDTYLEINYTAERQGLRIQKGTFYTISCLAFIELPLYIQAIQVTHTLVSTIQSQATCSELNRL